MEEHTILAKDETFGTVSVCPGGVVHVNLPHCSLKFLPSDFLKFSDLVGKARLSFDGETPRADGKPRLQVVSREHEESPEPDPTE